MVSILLRKTLSFNQLRQVHRNAVVFSAPTVNLKNEMSKENEAFRAVYPEVLNSAITNPIISEMPGVASWVKRALDYTITHEGKVDRGVTVSIAYRMLEDPQNYTEKTQRLARVLGWCLELIHTQFLMLDDAIDGSTTRRGKLCWYLQPDVGPSAVLDASLIYNTAMEVIKINFGKTPLYDNMTKLINEAVYRLFMGEHLENSSVYNKEKNNLEVFTVDRAKTIARYKTSYFMFRLPILLGALLANNRAPSKELENICLDTGLLQQLQNDYMDIYGDEAVTGKAGSDIEGGKCSWIAVTALQRCNEEQRCIFKEYYDSKDPKHVKRIRQLFEELNLPQVFKEHELSMRDDLVRRINALPSQEEAKLLSGLVNDCCSGIF